jgi:hypothetical protein
MTTYYGVVKDNRVILPPEVHLADGCTVEVRVPDDTALLAAKQALLAAGLIRSIRLPGAALPPHQRGLPVPTVGRPASEVLVEERR